MQTLAEALTASSGDQPTFLPSYLPTRLPSHLPTFPSSRLPNVLPSNLTGITCPPACLPACLAKRLSLDRARPYLGEDECVPERRLRPPGAEPAAVDGCEAPLVGHVEEQASHGGRSSDLEGGVEWWGKLRGGGG